MLDKFSTVLKNISILNFSGSGKSVELLTIWWNSIEKLFQNGYYQKPNPKNSKKNAIHKYILGRKLCRSRPLRKNDEIIMNKIRNEINFFTLNLRADCRLLFYLFVQWPLLNWITNNWISWLIESNLPGPDWTDKTSTIFIVEYKPKAFYMHHYWIFLQFHFKKSLKWW